MFRSPHATLFTKTDGKKVDHTRYAGPGTRSKNPRRYDARGRELEAAKRGK